ncbi:type IV pilus assembly protein PilX [Janthinobacterium sp. HH01]|uniref:pilus assembly PilX family protein n=1 Tax=Janthinobacterium sp. HH01 TaxID=1198452 RepID=UPI0002AE814D|nr:pilus assembly protein [Janthinobacterium sp. HH01]ELX13471.1 type IV pilus assembly protein PilX [Janthinobacterium sp. HH01]
MAVQRQRGVVVLMCLMMMLLAMLLGVSAAQMSLQGEKATRGERDRDVAFQAAEDALADAEHDIQDGAGEVSACDAPPVWQRVDLSGGEDGGACTLGYGAHTGAAMLTAEGVLPFRKPRYVVERMECHQPGEDASAGGPVAHCYRVTVIGFGARPATEIVLQTVYSKLE